MNSKNVLQTLEIGPQYGLKLTLFINSSTYIPTSIYSGVRVLIHHPTEYPFPEDFGILAAPGKLTSVGLSLNMGSLCKPPYGQCTTMTLEQQQILSAYVNLLPNVSYTKEGCKKTCLQRQIVLNCNCYNPYYPFSSNITAYQNMPNSSTLRKCDITDESTDSVCSENVKLAIMNQSLDCSNCTLACKRYTYVTTISQCNWPSDIAMADYLKQGMITRLGTMSAMKNSGVGLSNLVTNQILALEIYYDNFSYLDISDQPAYEIFSLISDLGGQMGLWLGLSIAALFELFELAYDIMKSIIELIVLKYVKNREKKKIQNKIKPAWEKS